MDVQPGQLTQSSSNPAGPATLVSGPILAGNIKESDGSANLAGVGSMAGGISNVGYAVMAQSAVITQATNGSVAGVFTAAQLVIPAQSQILDITLMVTTAWTGASKTVGIGNTVSATAYTAAGAGDGSARGRIVFSPGTDATAIGKWDNVGTSDVELVITSTNTGNGVGTLTVRYLQGVNLAS